MANSKYTPLPKQEEEEEKEKEEYEEKVEEPKIKDVEMKFTSTDNPKKPADPVPAAVSIGWTADGLPVGGEHMMQRAQWDSGLFSCLGRNDEFCGSDLEVCLLGGMAPCVLFGSNAERVGFGSGTFTNHCLPYTGLYLLGNSFFGWNCLAPWFSYPVRTAIRRKFNLEGNCEATVRRCGLSSVNFLDDEVHREQCETSCDFATHVFCHPCALCQEGREVRRRIPHPGYNTQQPVLVMIPPGGQTMGRQA